MIEVLLCLHRYRGVCIGTYIYPLTTKFISGSVYTNDEIPKKKKIQFIYIYMYKYIGEKGA